MRSHDIRKKFLEYFERNSHTVVPSSGLVPEKDPTLLFTNAGMVQFKGVFLNEETREYRRAASCQKCMRAGGKHNDLENVGRTARHHTFFEMLGNFSFGDYFKVEAIGYAWDFLTKEMKLPEERLWVTVYEKDDEAARIWREKVGVPADRIVRLGEKDNFWSMGDVGPCGPCSEMIIDQGEGTGCGRPTCAVGCDCDRYLEIWNLVFMQYNRSSDGVLTPLPKPCIDTGMGLERLSAVMQGKKSNYDTDLFAPVIGRIEELSGIRYGSEPDKDVSIKAIADHSRATSFLMADGVTPGNEGRGYVLRRIVRRAARHGRFLGLKEPFLFKVCDTVISHMSPVYPELGRARDFITRATRGEEERFFETLERGLGLLDEEVSALKGRKVFVIPGDVAFRLYDTYGFPVDLTADIVRRDGFTVDEEGFGALMEEQKARARSAWKGMEGKAAGEDLYRALSSGGVRSEFLGYTMDALSSRVVCIIKDGKPVDTAVKGDTVEIITAETPFYGESGGQVGDTGFIVGRGFTAKVKDTKRPQPDIIVHHAHIDEGSISVDDTVELAIDVEKRNSTRRNHTATHILHAALRKVLGEHVRQAGSLVSPKALRFDFNHFEAVSDKDLRAIEDLANRAVLRNVEVSTEALPYKEAVARGALAFFGEKYGEVVRLVSVEGVSAELCGGTHVRRTGDIGIIRVTGETSVAAGVRRIEALTGEAALRDVLEMEKALKEGSALLKVPRHEVPGKIRRLIEETRELEREVERLKGKSAAGTAETLLENVREVKGTKVLSAKVEIGDAKDLRTMADTLRAKLGSGVVVLGSTIDSKAMLLAAVTRDLTERISAGEIIKRLAPIIGGRGGGKADLAQAGGAEAGKLDDAIKEAYRAVEEMS